MSTRRYFHEVGREIPEGDEKSIAMSGFPPPSGSVSPVHIGESAVASGASPAALPEMSSIPADQLYGNMMVGSLPPMGGGVGTSAPPSPELGPVSFCLAVLVVVEVGVGVGVGVVCLLLCLSAHVVPPTDSCPATCTDNTMIVSGS